MTLKLHKPDGEGGLEPRGIVEPDWRGQLESPRWGSGLKRGRLPDLKNPEMNPTSRLRSVLFWLGLGVATFLLLVVGYGTGFWQRKVAPEPTPSPAALVWAGHASAASVDEVRL
ncbi:MAG: hypothetical protein ABJC39_06935 [Chloroflexota bacterium]